MNLTLSSSSLAEAKADILAIIVPADGWKTTLADVDDALDGALTELAQSEGFEGKPGQSFSLHTLGKLPSKRVLLVGAGDDQLPNDEVRELGGKIAAAAAKAHATTLCVLAPWGTGPLEGAADRSLRFVAEGVRLGAYRFDRFLTEPDDAPRLEAVQFLGASGAEDDLLYASAIADGVNLARNLVNEPPNVCNPAWLAEQAREIAGRYNFSATILDKDAIAAKGLNLLLAVGRGSAFEPRFIHLTYKPEGPISRKVAFVGKGVTFDTGGYNIKVGAGMMNMHCDMAGGAAVLGAAETIGKLAPQGVEVHFIVSSAENRVSNDAYTVNEIIKGYGGKTVEINNTDAEGRLCLADGLAYANELGVDEIINLATLTGACVVALGEQYSACFSNNDAFARRVLDAASEAGERIWHMPLDEKLRDKLKSPVADMRNTGDRWGGAITAALFLKEWVGETNWVHLDIAGPAFTETALPLGPKGGTGAGVATLVKHVTG